jgi:multidrug efflux pump subunit AcrA (membrane-fusion protein)
MQGYLQIRAPFNGIITARNVNPGAYVGPSGKGSELPLFTLQEQKKLRLVISVPEAYTSYLAHKNEVSFTVKSFPIKNLQRRVKRMAGAIDSRLHSERIEMDVMNNDKKLLPGMVAGSEPSLTVKRQHFHSAQNGGCKFNRKCFCYSCSE